MRRTEHVVMQLVSAFDAAHGAFHQQRRPGWLKASAELREAITEAAKIGDVSTLPCPLSWWCAAQLAARTWLEAPSDDVRRGLDTATYAVIRALAAYASGTIELAPAPHGRGLE